MDRSERMLRIALEDVRIAKEEKVQAEPWKYFPKDRLITSANCGETVHVSYHTQYTKAKASLDYSLEELLELSCREFQVPHFPTYLPPELPDSVITPRTLDEENLTTNEPIVPIRPEMFSVPGRTNRGIVKALKKIRGQICIQKMELTS